MTQSAPYLRSPVYAIALSAILLSGCAASSGAYPSLAIRDAERVQGSFAADAVPAPSIIPPIVEASPSADLVTRLAQLQAAAGSAHRAFLGQAPEAGRLVNAAADASITSDSWSSAQIALASLEAARSQAAVPLGDLDLMHADAALALEQRGAIEDTRDAVTKIIAEEDAILSNLRGKLAS